MSNVVKTVFYIFFSCFVIVISSKKYIQSLLLDLCCKQTFFHLIFKCFPINPYTEGSLESCELGITFNNQPQAIYEKTEIQRSLGVALGSVFNIYLLGLNPISFFFLQCTHIPQVTDSASLSGLSLV